jgi:hypothetical protein
MIGEHLLGAYPTLSVPGEAVREYLANSGITHTVANNASYIASEIAGEAAKHHQTGLEPIIGIACLLALAYHSLGRNYDSPDYCEDL